MPLSELPRCHQGPEDAAGQALSQQAPAPYAPRDSGLAFFHVCSGKARWASLRLLHARQPCTSSPSKRNSQLSQVSLLQACEATVLPLRGTLHSWTRYSSLR